MSLPTLQGDLPELRSTPLKSNNKFTSVLHLISPFLILASLAVMAGVPTVSYASAISTSTESEQATNQVMAADKLKDQLSAELQSIIGMGPIMLDTSSGPFYSENVTREGASYLSERFSIGVLSGSGKLRLPNSTSFLNFTTTGNEITDAATSAVVSNETITSEPATETAKVSMFQIAHYRSDDGIQRNAVIAIFATNSTDALAPLDGMIGIGESQITEGGDLQVKLWTLANS
jgi:hypothetical protein